MEWLFFAIGAPFLWSLGNVVHRHVRVARIQSATVLAWLIMAANLLVALVVILSIGYRETDLRMALLAGVLHFGGYISYIVALKYDEVSRVVSLWAITPIFALLIAVFFRDEAFALSQLVAVVLILGGGLALQSRNWRDVIRPRKAFWMMLLSAGFFTCSYLVFKTVYLGHDYFSTFFVARVGEFGAATILLVVVMLRGYGAVSHSLASLRSVSLLRMVLCVQVISLAGDMAGEYAIKLGSVPLVLTLFETQGFFVLLTTTVLHRWLPSSLHEDRAPRILAQKGMAIAAMIAGVGVMAS